MRKKYVFPYWFRYLGWGLVVAHIPISMIGRKNGMVNPFDNPDSTNTLFSGEHLFFISTTLLLSLGLFFVAFASERTEDEQIQQIRLDSLRWAICVNYLILLISLVLVKDIAHVLELNLWVPLFFFILRFRWQVFLLNRSLSREG